jgi:hypothetical protein
MKAFFPNWTGTLQTIGELVYLLLKKVGDATVWYVKDVKAAIEEHPDSHLFPEPVNAESTRMAKSKPPKPAKTFATAAGAIAMPVDADSSTYIRIGQNNFIGRGLPTYLYRILKKCTDGLNVPFGPLVPQLDYKTAQSGPVQDWSRSFKIFSVLLGTRERQDMSAKSAYSWYANLPYHVHELLPKGYFIVIRDGPQIHTFFIPVTTDSLGQANAEKFRVKAAASHPQGWQDAWNKGGLRPHHVVQHR